LLLCHGFKTTQLAAWLVAGPITALPNVGERQIFRKVCFVARVYDVHTRELCQQINETNHSLNIIKNYPTPCILYIYNQKLILPKYGSFICHPIATLYLPSIKDRLGTSDFHSQNLKCSEKKHSKYTCCKIAIVWNVI